MSDDPKEKRQHSIGGRFPDKEDNTDKTPKTDKEEKADKNERPSTKDKTALTMYLKEEIVKQEDFNFQSINLEHQEQYDRKLQKNADYWPAVFEAAHSDKTVREVLGLED